MGDGIAYLHGLGINTIALLSGSKTIVVFRNQISERIEACQVRLRQRAGGNGSQLNFLIVGFAQENTNCEFEAVQISHYFAKAENVLISVHVALNVSRDIHDVWTRQFGAWRCLAQLIS